MTLRLYIPVDAAALAVGAEEVASALHAAAARHNVAVDLVRNGSRGLYWLEPMVEVATPVGRVAYGPVAPSDAEGLLAAILADGAHALRLGPTEDIPWLKRQTRLTFARCGIVDPRSLEDYRAHGGCKGLERALSLGAEASVEEVVQSGLRGRGGAGFPTGIKWRTVAQTQSTQKYIVCNADEGDSGTFADRMIMEGDPFVLIEGMAIAGIATGATKGYVYIRSEYPHAVAAMEAAIAAARRGGLLGNRVAGSSFTFDMEVRVGAGAYVCGEETSLLDSLEGKRGQVRAKPPLPAHKGLFGRPTVINNVLSLASVPIILDRAPPSIVTSAWAARGARCRSSSPATSSMAAFTRRRSVSRSANSSTTSVAARAAAVRYGRCRSAARSAPIFRVRCLIRRSTTKLSPRATA
jgi:formate dehydrogenase iron-sulfur subunit